MSGETEQNVSAWTPDTLLELMNERDRRYGERFAAQEKAIAVAEMNAEKWRMNANEWREAMNDRERNFLSKNMGIVLAIVSTVALGITVVQKVLP